MKAADVMTREVVTTTPDGLIEEVAQTMLRRRVSGVPVVDQNGQVKGIVTEGDLLRRAETGTERLYSRWLEFFLSPGRLARDYVHSHTRKVSDVMTSKVVSVAPETPLAEVVALIESRGIKRLPVVENGRLVGIVSRADLLRALADLLPKVPGAAMTDAEIRRHILAEIDGKPWAPPTGIDAVVKDGVVELYGAITDEREREALRVAAENVPGVKRIRDHLVWVEPTSGIVIDAPIEDDEPAKAAPSGREKS